MAQNDYIPKDDCGFQMWAESLSACIAGEPEKYRFSPDDAAELAAAVRGFSEAFQVASSEATRTRAMVAAKDAARLMCERTCRRFAMAIKLNESICDADKVCAGVRPVEKRRKRIEPPHTQPLLNILGNTVVNGQGSQTVVYADIETPDKKGKPWYASALQLHLAITREPDAPLSEAKHIGAFTRNPIVIDFDARDDGMVSTYYARWVNPRGETGPWSLPVSFRIAA